MRFLVTAGPTREFADPVRFLSNPSTGKMGFAVARAAARAGHDAVLVAGPVSLPTPPGVERVDVVSACDMLEAVRSRLPECDALVMCAAVADWRPARRAASKLKKGAMDGTLALVRNPDVLKTLAADKGDRIFAGFAAETGDPGAEAMRKLREKNLDLIAANDVSAPGCGFASETNSVTVYTAFDAPVRIPLMRKSAVAARLVRMIGRIAAARSAPLVLASKSPRRAKILESLGVEFTAEPTGAPEISLPHDPAGTVRANAAAKMRACRAKHPGAAVLAADTIVWCGGRIYGKPRDAAGAAAFLGELSGRTHTVFTGVAYCGPDGAERVCTAESHVRFKKLSPRAIARYIAVANPLDRAGAYDIDEHGSMLVEGWTGEYENIMGLPVAPLRGFLCRPFPVRRSGERPGR